MKKLLLLTLFTIQCSLFTALAQGIPFIRNYTALEYGGNSQNFDIMTGENGNYQWADWLSYEPLESSSGRSHENGQPKADAVVYWNYLSASYWAIDAGMMSDMARATGRNAALYDKMLAEAKAYILDKFLNGRILRYHPLQIDR